MVHWVSTWGDYPLQETLGRWWEPLGSSHLQREGYWYLVSRVRDVQILQCTGHPSLSLSFFFLLFIYLFIFVVGFVIH